MWSLAQIKAWFETGDRPTQTQFENTWDSFQHVDDTVTEYFDDLSSGFVTVSNALPDPATKTDAEIHKAVEVKEGRGTMFSLDNDVPFGFKINKALNTIELLDKNENPFRVPPSGTRLVVKINKKYV